MKQLITQKLFFDHYDHRVTMNVAHQWRQNDTSKYPHPEVVERLIRELDPKHGIRVRHSPVLGRKPSQHCIYFADKRVLELLHAKFGDFITEVMQPLNENQTAAMKADQVLVRKSLFHGKYRYCIRTSRRHIPGTYKSTSAHMTAMVEWCKEAFKDRVEKQDYYIYNGFTKNFFFNNPADVLLMKLTWADDIDRTERILLQSEVQPDKPTE